MKMFDKDKISDEDALKVANYILQTFINPFRPAIRGFRPSMAGLAGPVLDGMTHRYHELWKLFLKELCVV